MRVRCAPPRQKPHTVGSTADNYKHTNTVCLENVPGAHTFKCFMRIHACKQRDLSTKYIHYRRELSRYIRMVRFIKYPYENVCMAADGSLMFILLIAACLIVHFVSFARTRNCNIKSNLLFCKTQPEI